MTKSLQYITILLFALASVWMGCKDITDDCRIRMSDSLHVLSKERFDGFSDSMNSNLNRCLNCIVIGKQDSAMFYSGKSVAYFEMESKELKK